MSVRNLSAYGRFTSAELKLKRKHKTLRKSKLEKANSGSYEVAKPQLKDANHWSSTENNSNNAWNVNFNDGNNNNNNNNKYNSNVVRPVVACAKTINFYESVLVAYKDCLRGKTKSKEAIEYEYIAHEDLHVLASEMWLGNYEPTTSTCFMVHRPKDREVFAANFRDRIVHHWICLRLEPLFEEKVFIKQGNVSFNCRKGFGTQAAVKHISSEFKRLTENYQKEVYYFKGDLTGFFMSISKPLLNQKLQRFIDRYYRGDYPEILKKLVEVTVMHHPERNCVINSNIRCWNKLPRNKSLFFTDEKGMPIGNLTTQLFANFLMSDFDLYVKFLFRHKNYAYARFVDDFIIACGDTEYLKSTIKKLEKFLDEKLQLKLHEKKRAMQPISHGVLFCGTYIKNNRNYLSNRTIGNFMIKMHAFNKTLMSREVSTMEIAHMVATVNSYLGFCKGLKTFKVRKKAFELINKEIFDKYFITNEDFTIFKAKEPYRQISSKTYKNFNRKLNHYKKKWKKSHTAKNRPQSQPTNSEQ